MNRDEERYTPVYETDTTDMTKVVFNHEIEEEPVILFDPDGNEVARTNSELCFYDALLQIKRKRLAGYTCAMADEPNIKYDIDIYGHIKYRPRVMFCLFEEMLNDMLFG